VPNDAALIDYYAKRASEYERIYDKPERQPDLAALKERFRQLFAGHDVLEIACGTGYWTQIISQTAKTVTATDVNEAVLQIARAKDRGGVRFHKADAFNLAFIGECFSAGLAAAWWSHLRKSEIRNFLSQFHRQFSSGALIVFLDNQFVPGSSTPIARTDGEGNTYQLRKLDDGSQHEVLKNFPTEAEAREAVGNAVTEFSWMQAQYYWMLTYKLK
jgi:SAM-dependent methyltransferase